MTLIAVGKFLANLDFPVVSQIVVVRGAGKGLLYLHPPEVEWAIERLARRSSTVRGCYHWHGYIRNGYPSLSVRNSLVYGHQLAFVAAGGVLKAGNDVCHTCDNRRCWNYRHLFSGSREENVHDCWAKGRAIAPPRISGANHYRAVLTDLEVEAIRESVLPQRVLAAEYGCSQSTVWRIRHNKVRTT